MLSLPDVGSFCILVSAGMLAGCAASGSTGATAGQSPRATTSAVSLGPSSASGDDVSHAIDLLGTPSEEPRAGTFATNKAPALAAHATKAAMADTVLCHRFHDVVVAARTKFDTLGRVNPSGENGARASTVVLPGAQRCVIVSGGPGHEAVATYSCEFITAPPSASPTTSANSSANSSPVVATGLAAQRDAVAHDLRACASMRALESTRVRVVWSAGAAILVVNIHDSARW